VLFFGAQVALEAILLFLMHHASIINALGSLIHTYLNNSKLILFYTQVLNAARIPMTVRFISLSKADKFLYYNQCFFVFIKYLAFSFPTIALSNAIFETNSQLQILKISLLLLAIYLKLLSAIDAITECHTSS
jgi:hypothetical protein